MIYKALPETRHSAALRVFWRLQLETKGNDGYALSCSLQAFCSCFCSKKCLYTQTQCFHLQHLETHQQLTFWSEEAEQNQISCTSLLLNNYFWYILFSNNCINFYPTDFWNTTLSRTVILSQTLPLKVDSHKKSVLVYWSVKIVSWEGCWTIFSFWNLAWIEIQPFRPHYLARSDFLNTF